MRNLTRKQKRLLKEEYLRIKSCGVEYPTIDDIPHETWNEINDINPCEIYYQNVDRFFWDMRWDNDGLTSN